MNNFWSFEEVVILVLGASWRRSWSWGSRHEIESFVPSLFLLPSYTLDYLGHGESVAMTLKSAER